MWETHQCRPHAYGHTWSPGYELPAGMLHGHAVATGMGFGAYLSFCKGWVTTAELERILKLMSDLELSLWHPIMEDAHKIYRAQKKMIEKRGGNLAAPVPKGLGKCGYINHLPYELLVKRLQEYQGICQGYPRGGLGVEVHCREVGLQDPSTEGCVNGESLKFCNGTENGVHHDGNLEDLSCVNGESSKFCNGTENGVHHDGNLEGLSCINGESPKFCNGTENGVHHDGNLEDLPYSEWIESVQKKRTKGLSSLAAFEHVGDTPKPPPFQPNKLCHTGE